MTRTGLIFILVAFAGGGFVGYLAGAGTGDIVYQAHDAGESARSPEPPERELTPMPPAPTGGFTSLEHALEAIPYSPAGDGAGMFSGTVKTVEGEPLEGVTVRAIPRRPNRPRSRTPSGVPEDQNLEEMVREYVARVMEDRKNRREGITDKNGRFVIPGIGDGKHYLQAFKEGYSFQAAGNRNYNIEAGAEVEFTARSLGLLRVQMTMPDGSEPEAAWIKYKMPQGYWNTVGWDPESPEIELAPGTHALSATAGDEQEYQAGSLTVTIEEGTTPDPIHFQLESRPGIRGKIELPAGELVGNLMVYVAEVRNGEIPDEKQLRSERQPTWVQPQNPSYKFYDLQPGTWAVGVSFDQRTFELIETVTVGDAMAELDLTLPEPRREEYLVVRAVTAGGGPVANVRFTTRYRSERNSGSSNSRVVRMPDGTYHVWHPQVPEKVEGPVTYEITAQSPQYGTKTVEYDRTPTSMVELVFEEPGTLVVTIAGYAGSGREGKMGLAVQTAEGRQSSWFHPSGNNQPDQEGKQTFTNLAPGAYEIVIYLQRERSRYFPAARVPITVKSGENQETVSIPVFYSLTVLAPDADDGTRFSLYESSSRGGPRFSANAESVSGKAVFDNVPAGTFRLRGRVGGSRETMEVTVPGQSMVRFEPVVKDCLRVDITAAEGRLASAGFSDGDLVVAIDGVTLTGESQAMTLLRAAYVKPRAVLTVLRGRGTVDLAVDLRRNEGDPGGRFIPATR